MYPEHDMVSFTDFARQPHKQTAEIRKHDRPRVLTYKGRASAVVLSVACYEELRHHAEEHRLDLRLQKALEPYAKGDRGTSAATALNKIRARAEKRRKSK